MILAIAMLLAAVMLLGVSNTVGLGLAILSPVVLVLLTQHYAAPRRYPTSNVSHLLGGCALVLAWALGSMGLLCLACSLLNWAIVISLTTFLLRCLRPIAEPLLRSTGTLLLLACLPIGVALLEDAFPPEPHIVSKRTTRVIAAPPITVWQSLRTYDELRHPRPFLLELGFPVPLRVEGALASIGDRQCCYYDKGHVRKRVEAFEIAQRYAFRVTEQSLGFERSVRLREGSFELEHTETGQTRVTLTTTYDARLRPRIVWFLQEWIVLDTLHDYILDGLEMEVHGDEPTHTRPSMARR